LLKSAIPVFRVSRSEAAEAFYCGRLGFRREFTHRPDTLCRTTPARPGRRALGEGTRA
jgi:hypothetical protein